MNLCYVYQLYSLNPTKNDSGIATYLYLLINRLQKNHHIHVITTGDSVGVIKQKNATIHVLPKFPLKRLKSSSLNFIIHNLLVAYTLAKIHRRQKLSLIEFVNWQAEGLFFTIFINPFLHIPNLIHLFTDSSIIAQSNGNRQFFTRFITLAEKIFVRMNQHFVTHTQEHARISSTIYGLDKTKIHLIPLGLNLPASTTPSPHTLKNLGINRQLNNLLIVGRMEKRKGIDFLIKAIPLVLERKPQTQFYLIGADYINIDQLIRNQIPIRYQRSVTYLGRINQATLHEFYQACTFCILPSLYESFFYTAAEAMSYGKAVISTNIGGIPELIATNTNGLLVKPGNFHDLAKAIILLLNHKEVVQSLGLKARNTISTKYRLTSMVQNTLDYYQALIS
jgi:glycosyltransferase involved in cell wall biosynthesis